MSVPLDTLFENKIYRIFLLYLTFINQIVILNRTFICLHDLSLNLKQLFLKLKLRRNKHFMHQYTITS